MKYFRTLGLALILAACSQAAGSEPTTAPETTTPETTVAAVATTTTVAPTTTTTRAPTTTTAVIEPVLSDFLLELIVTEKQCFGSAGCLITVEPDLYYDGPDLHQSYTLVYEIYGGEDGTVTYNLNITEDGTYSYDDEMIGTAGLNDELTVAAVLLLDR